jgi:hypothetical protein
LTPPNNQPCSKRKGKKISSLGNACDSQGVFQHAISVQLGIDRRTVRRWTRVGGLPERARVKRRSSLDRFTDYLQRSYRRAAEAPHGSAESCANKGFAELIASCATGFSTYVPNARCRTGAVVTWRDVTASLRQTAWLFLQQPTEANAYSAELSRLCHLRVLHAD